LDLGLVAWRHICFEEASLACSEFFFCLLLGEEHSSDEDTDEEHSEQAVNGDNQTLQKVALRDQVGGLIGIISKRTLLIS